MSVIELKDVVVDLPIFNSQGRSLKKTAIGFATGGRLGLTESGKTIVRALEGISFSACEGERIGIIGHNGSGKSTLLRVLGGVLTPTSGLCRVEGRIGSLIDVSLGIDPEATGLENIFLRGALLEIPKSKIEDNLDDLIEFTQLGEFINMPVRTYSAGMHMRLAFGVSTMVSSDILLMDEWLSVGDKEFQGKAEERMKKLIRSAKVLVIASHSRELIESISTKVIWLEHGRIKQIGLPSAICSSYFD